jgi:hypothetical protein
LTAEQKIRGKPGILFAAAFPEVFEFGFSMIVILEAQGLAGPGQ